MNKNIVIVLIGGFVIAVLVAVLVQASLGGGKKDQEEEITQFVLVAAKDIPVGRELNADDLEWKKWPQSVIFPGAIIRDGEQPAGEAIAGKTMRSIKEGEPIHMGAVVEEEGGFLTAKVGQGMRAVGIEVRKYIVADRLIQPGDLFDVIMTYRVRVNARNNPEVQTLVNRHASETILQNVRILAIDDNTSTARGDDDKKKSKKKSGKKAIVTLEVTPEGAEQLALAKEMGDISFAARGISKDAETEDNNVTTDVQMSKVLTDLSKMTSGSGRVRIYNGDTMQEVIGRGVRVSDEGGVDFSVEDRPQTTILNVPQGANLQELQE